MTNFCIELYNFSFFTWPKIISPIGVFLNTLTLIGIIKTGDFRSNNLFRYMLAKELCDIFYLLSDGLNDVYDVYNGAGGILYRTSSSCLYGTEFAWWLLRSFSFMSQFFEIASCFNRYRVITKCWEGLDLIPFLLKMLTIIFVCASYNIFFFWAFSCTKFTLPNNTLEYYQYSYNEFGNPFVYSVLEDVTSIVRDLICSIVLIVLNVMTMIVMRRAMERKKNLAAGITSNDNNSNNSSKVSRADRAQTKTTQMVVATCFLAIIGHLPRFVYFILNFSFSFNTKCINGISYMMFLASHTCTFFILLFFNRKFSAFYESIFKFLFKFSRQNKSNTNVNSIVVS